MTGRQTVQPRRKPMQARSRERLERILDAAQGLLVTHNPENLAMREVARQAGVPISSLYQYYPSKSAIIRALVERNIERVSALLQGELERLLTDHGGRPSIGQAVDRVVDAYFGHYRDHPETIAVWAGAQADDELRRLDVIDTRHTADLLVPHMMTMLSSADRERTLALALLLTEITGHAARLALAMPLPMRDAIIVELKAMMVAALERHAESRPPAAEAR